MKYPYDMGHPCARCGRRFGDHMGDFPYYCPQVAPTSSLWTKTPFDPALRYIYPERPTAEQVYDSLSCMR